MKRWLTILTVLTGVAGVIVHGTLRGQGPGPRPMPTPPAVDPGPGEQGATLKQPWMEGPVKSGLPAAGGINQLWNPAVNSGMAARIDPANPFGSKVALPPTNATDMNRDIELTKEHGNWVIFLIAYTGEKAPQLARKCVIEMRTNPHYKLNAFVFNYGAEEKRKEYDRVQKLREKLKEEQKALKDRIQADVVMQNRIRVAHFDEQTGVLIAGGFKTREDAQAALTAIRKLPNPDPKKVDMDIISGDFEERADPGAGRTPRVSPQGTRQAFISPFVTAFVARNPCLPKDTQNPEQEKFDMSTLRALNAGEPYCLLACKNRFTLVVKQFNTQVVIQDRPKQATGFIDNMFGKQGMVDYAAKNAASLVELLRRGGCNEAYVLHTKFCSYVTVGGFDTMSDPRILGTQTALQKGFHDLVASDPRLGPVIQSLDLPMQYQPMLIPH